MAVRAKFYVAEVARYAYNPDQARIKLMAVTRGADNKSWASATPVGELTMHINNAAASDQFILGDEFYLDFTPAPKGQEG